MKNKTGSIGRKVRYHFYSFLATLIGLIGYIGIKCVIVIVAILIAINTEKYIGDWGKPVGFFIGLFVGGVLLKGIERLPSYLERLDKYSKTFKDYPYTEKYGKDYALPKPEDFGITQADFQDYNKRFQFSYIKLIFTYGIWIAACIPVLKNYINGSYAIIILGSAGLLAILLNSLFNYLNKRISQKHNSYKKIHEYQKAVDIYYKVREENTNF